MMNSEADTESYLLLLLSDGNLPTGSFVASSGLESLFAHALASPHPHNANGPGTTKAHSDPLLTITSSIRDSLSSYARSAIPFVRDTHRVVEDYATTAISSDDALDTALEGLLELDALYECSTLNHVARRASSTQGVALLTLYSKGFAVPSFISSSSSTPQDPTADGTKRGEARMVRLVDRLKLLVRRGDTPGHLPVCWGVLAGALGLSLSESFSSLSLSSTPRLTYSLPSSSSLHHPPPPLPFAPPPSSPPHSTSHLAPRTPQLAPLNFPRHLAPPPRPTSICSPPPSSAPLPPRSSSLLSSAPLSRT